MVSEYASKNGIDLDTTYKVWAVEFQKRWVTPSCPKEGFASLVAAIDWAQRQHPTSTVVLITGPGRLQRLVYGAVDPAE